MSSPRTRRRSRPKPARRRQAEPAPVPAPAAAPRRRLALPRVVTAGIERLDRLAARVPFLARWRRPKFTRQDVLSARPFRNELIEWELRGPEGGEREGGEESGGEGKAGGEAEPVVVLRVPRRQDRLGRILSRLFQGPPHRQVVLDELGTDVWQLCDGSHTVEELIRALARKHKLERREVEVSLTQYLQLLARRGFIGLRLERE